MAPENKLGIVSSAALWSALITIKIQKNIAAQLRKSKHNNPI